MKCQYDEALTHFDQALSLDASHNFSLACKGEILRERKDYDAAIDCFNAALKGKPNDSWALDKKYLALKDKGYALACNEKNDEALNCFEQALEIKPHDLSVLRYKAAVLYQKGEYDQSIILCAKILLTDPKDVYTLNVKGVSYNAKYGHEVGVTCFDKALEIDFNNIYALRCKGTTLHMKGDYVGAIEYFNAVLKIEPNDELTLEKKSFALKEVRYPTPFKQLVDTYNRYFFWSSKKEACAAMVVAASDIKKSVTEQLCSILQNLFDLKFLEAKYVKSESGDMRLLPARDSAEEVLLQNLLDVWSAIPNKKMGDQLRVIECLNDLHIKAYYQEGWFSEDSWLPIEKADADRILAFLGNSFLTLETIALEQKKLTLQLQSQFEDFILLLLKIEAGFAKDHKQQGVKRRFILNEHHTELKALIELSLVRLWQNIFNGDVWSFKRFIKHLEEKEKDQFYALHQKQLGRKYLGTYCSILPQVLCYLRSFNQADLAAQQAINPLPLPPRLPVGKAPSSVNAQKNILLNRIGLSDDDSKVVGDILVTRKEIEPNFDNLNSYYSADFINLLLYPLKQIDSENIVVCPATTLEQYPKYFEDGGIGTQKQRYVFIPLHVYFDPKSQVDRNHWAALIVDKQEQIIFYLDPAIVSTPQAVEVLREKLGYKNPIVTNSIDFQEAEKAKDQSIRHCGVYVVEILRTFAQCIRNHQTIIHIEQSIEGSGDQCISLKSILKMISYGLKEATVHRKNHVDQVNDLLRTLPEIIQTNASIPKTHPEPPNVCLVPELEDKSQKSLIAFCEVLVGKLEARRTTSEVMSSGIIKYTEKGTWAKLKKAGWMILKSAPVAGKVMKYGHLGCQIGLEFLGTWIEGGSWEIGEASWIEPVTEHLETVKSVSKGCHAALDFFHEHWKFFKEKSDQIDSKFREWIDGSEVNTAREYEQFRELFCTDAGKDALNRFVHSLIERYTRQLILLDEKEGAKQLAEAIDEHLGRLFLLNFEKWNLPQWGAQKHVMVLEIMRQWVTYMGFLKQKIVKLASGETTTAQALLQHCGVYLDGDKQQIEIDVIIDWDAGANSHFISNSSRYGHRKAEGILVEELKGHLQNGDELLQAYQKRFASQKTAKELEMLKELGHVMGIQFDDRTLRAFRGIKEINSCEKETWKSLAEETQANKEKLGHMAETVGELKEDLGVLKERLDSLQEEAHKSEVSSMDAPKINHPPVSQGEPAQITIKVPDGFVLVPKEKVNEWENRMDAANEAAAESNKTLTKVQTELQEEKKKNGELEIKFNELKEVLNQQSADIVAINLKLAHIQQYGKNDAALPHQQDPIDDPILVDFETMGEKVVDDDTGNENDLNNELPLETEVPAPLIQNFSEAFIEQPIGSNCFSSVFSKPKDLQKGILVSTQDTDARSMKISPENIGLKFQQAGCWR